MAELWFWLVSVISVSPAGIREALLNFQLCTSGGLLNG